MKRLFTITLAAFLVIGLSTTSFAQSDNATAAATASVEAPISVAQAQDIAYNTLNTTSTGDQAPGTPGQFTVSGTSGASVSLSFTKSDLTHTSTGSGDRTLVLNLATSGTQDGAWEDTESSDFSSAGNKFFLGSGTNVTIPGTSGNDIVVWANPTVTVDGTEVPGSYSGSVTLEATYN